MPRLKAVLHGKTCSKRMQVNNTAHRADCLDQCKDLKTTYDRCTADRATKSWKSEHSSSLCITMYSNSMQHNVLMLAACRVLNQTVSTLQCSAAVLPPPTELAIRHLRGYHYKRHWTSADSTGCLVYNCYITGAGRQITC